MTTSELGDLRDRIDALMLGRIKTAGITFQLDGESQQYSNLPKHTAGPPVETLAYRRIDELHNDSLFLAYMQRPALPPHHHALHRRGRLHIPLDVHEQTPPTAARSCPGIRMSVRGWGIDTNPIATVWTTLDDATVETGCMQIVPGSHRLGILNENHYTSEKDQAAHCTDEKLIDFEAEAGEAILIHNWLLHRSGVNKTDRPRRAFSIAYMDAATTHVKTGETFPIIFGKDALRSAA